MLLLGAAFASPLVVTDTPVGLPDPTVDAAPADKQPDGWTTTLDVGRFEMEAVRGPNGEPAARLKWGAGTLGKICTSPLPVPVGQTLVVRGQERPARDLEGFMGLHLHLAGDKGIVHTAKRRIEANGSNWEDVMMLATVPTGAKTAQLCLDVRGDGKHGGAYVDLVGLSLVSRDARSRDAVLPTKRVILVTVEAFNRDHVHAYGYPRSTTPNLDQLIREGTSFDRHYATAPYTHPSLASLLTGVMPTMLGFVDNTPVLPPALPTLPERLADAGYVTASFSSQYILSNRYGLNRGFHYYRNHPNDVTAATLNAELLPFLDAHRDDNLFTWVHYFDPHGPYRPPAGWREKFVGDAAWTADSVKLTADPKAAEGVAAIPNYVYDKEKLDRRWYVAGYDGDIAYWDSELGKLMAFVRARGWEEDTVILLTADHGESMTDHGRYFCHGSLWEHDIHVPMVVWGKGIPADRRVDLPTSHLDLMPTMLALAGVLPADAPRASMLTDDPERLAIATLGKGDALRWAVRDGGFYKIIMQVGGVLDDVYNLSVDRAETRPIGVPPKDASALASRFRKLLAAGFGDVRVVNTPTLDDEERERLRALGYIE